jgi:cystathionine gamma-synthase
MSFEPFQELPLGSTVTGSPHSVCLHLPRLADVAAYEEKDAATLAAIGSGYPRFFENPLLRAWRLYWQSRYARAGETAWLAATAAAAADLRDFAGAGRLVDGAGHTALCLPAADAAANERARLYLQHTGASLSSREAEDALHAAGARAEVFAEDLDAGDASAAAARIRAHLHAVYGTRSAADILLCRGGMNAFYAGFQALRAVQAARGRHRWIQLGWLYVDSIRILAKWSDPATPPIVLHDPGDLDRLAELLAGIGGEVAGIVTEVPTNPLLQTADLPRLHALARRHGVALVLDPTLVSPHNVHVLPYADLHINSLTKYAAGAADVMLGALAVAPDSPLRDELLACIAAHACPPYGRDLRRLAAQIGGYADLVERVNRTAPVVIDWLGRQPGIGHVWWAEQPACVHSYRRVRQADGGPGAVCSFALKGSMAAFYDRVRLVKSPSFGTRFTMLCPFLHLAHYDLVTSPQGRARLAACGLHPDLIRLSLGTEAPEAIIAVLAEALAGS